MNEKKLKQMNILALLAVLCGVIFIVVFSFFMSPNENKILRENKLTDYSEGWVLKAYNGGTDRLVDLPENVKAKAGETLVLMKRVPEGCSRDTVLVFETEFQNVLVTVDDKKMYTSGVMTDQKLIKNAVPCYNMVELKASDSDSVIAIYLLSGYKRYSGSLPKIYFGSKGDVIAGIMRQSGFGFILSGIILLITILLAVSLMFMKNINVDKRKGGYAFGFIIATTLWGICDSDVMQLLTGNTFGLYMSSMVLILLLPILYLMYQRCFAMKRRFAKILDTGIYVFCVNFLTGLVFQLVGVCDFAGYIIFTKVLITVALILLSGLMYLAADTYMDKIIYNNFIANVIITGACLLEGLLSLFKFYKSYDGTLLQTGLYIFLIFFVITVQKDIIREMNRSRDAAISTIEQERDMAMRNINTKLIISTLSLAAGEIKDTDKKNSRLIYDATVYMKYNIKTVTENGMVPFYQELEYVKSYLGMQKRQKPDMDIVIEDKVIDFSVPFNTIEPLVENAVVNGALSARAFPRLVFRSYERLDCYAIQIVDNGRGIGPDKSFYGKQSFKSVKKKLKTMCGGGIEIKCKPDKGTIVTVKIPKEGYIIKE